MCTCMCIWCQTVASVFVGTEYTRDGMVIYICVCEGCSKPLYLLYGPFVFVQLGGCSSTSTSMVGNGMVVTAWLGCQLGIE